MYENEMSWYEPELVHFYSISGGLGSRNSGKFSHTAQIYNIMV